MWKYVSGIQKGNRKYDYMPNISDADVYMMLPFINVLVGIAISYEASRAKSGGWL